LFAFVGALRAEISFEDELRAVRRESPEEIHGGGADAAGKGQVAGRAVERGEEGLLDVVLGEKGEVKGSGERAGDGGFAGSGRTGDEDDAARHVFYCEPCSAGKVRGAERGNRCGTGRLHRSAFSGDQVRGLCHSKNTFLSARADANPAGFRGGFV